MRFLSSLEHLTTRHGHQIVVLAEWIEEQWPFEKVSQHLSISPFLVFAYLACHTVAAVALTFGYRTRALSKYTHTAWLAIGVFNVLLNPTFHAVIAMVVCLADFLEASSVLGPTQSS